MFNHFVQRGPSRIRDAFCHALTPNALTPNVEQKPLDWKLDYGFKACDTAVTLELIEHELHKCIHTQGVDFTLAYADANEPLNIILTPNN